jgi:hypothetical protein
MAGINVKDTEINIMNKENGAYISITDMLKSKDDEFFVSDWLRNRNTVEFLCIWESIYNPNFNYGEFAIIKSKAWLNNYKISVKENKSKIMINSLHSFLTKFQDLFPNHNKVGTYNFILSINKKYCISQIISVYYLLRCA